MISQADIIRTLVNKNCTDESVMTMVLSPDCTPPKLLEKLTETERFDLALDFSMKLGLDVILLWKTWALRSLWHRNFQGAREKFRHCFLRLRLPGDRSSPAQARLLEDILSELARMDETKLPLSEEVELIKQGKEAKKKQYSSDESSRILQEPLVTTKPTIYAECMYYLTEYGNIYDRIKFYSRNSLWRDCVQVLLVNSSQKNIDKFFVKEVVLYSTPKGQLSSLIGAFLNADPNVSLSAKYFKAVYDLCLRNRKYNLLYYVQSTICDYIAAANTRINLFFLKKPVSSYRELNQRISSLIDARQNYLDYLEAHSTNRLEAKEKQNSILFSFEQEKDVERQLKLIDLQIDITRNFALNEVSGCINDIDLSVSGDQKEKTTETSDNNSPVTLFDKSERRKTFLAALVLIYFDLNCSVYFSKNGLDLANRLISDHKLDKLRVFKIALRIILEDDSCDILENAQLLLERIKEDFSATKKEETKEEEESRRGFGSKAPGSRVAGAVGRQAGVGGKFQFKKSSSTSAVLGSGENGSLAASSSELRQSASSSPSSSSSTTASAMEPARSICDEVILDSIKSCREPDYKMELAKLLSGEAKIKLYIENGKLSNAQRLACDMNRPDYVSSIIEEAAKLNQHHVKTVCQHWLAKHV